jgi:hypothetical protein
LLKRLPGLAIVDAEVKWKAGMATRGPEPLMLTWDEPRNG